MQFKSTTTTATTRRTSSASLSHLGHDTAAEPAAPTPKQSPLHSSATRNWLCYHGGAVFGGAFERAVLGGGDFAGWHPHSELLGTVDPAECVFPLIHAMHGVS